MDIMTKAVTALVLLAASLLSGLWLSRKGRPLPSALLTIHKIISLAGAAWLVALLVQQHRIMPLGAAIWVAAIAWAVCFVAAIASGGALSLDRPVRTPILRLHQIAPMLTALGGTVTLYLLLVG